MYACLYVCVCICSDSVIVGWQAMLQSMKEGQKVRVLIPYQLAYGEDKKDEKIGAKQALMFDIEVINVVGASPKREESPGNYHEDANGRPIAPEHMTDELHENIGREFQRKKDEEMRKSREKEPTHPEGELQPDGTVQYPVGSCPATWNDMP